MEKGVERVRGLDIVLYIVIVLRGVGSWYSALGVDFIVLVGS